MVEGIIFGIIITDVLVRAIRSWGIFDPIRDRLKQNDFFRRLLSCYECTSVWVACFVAIYIFYINLPILTYFLVIIGLAKWFNTLYEWLDASRAKKEGEI